MLKRTLLAIAVFLAVMLGQKGALASVSRIVSADSFKSADQTKTWTPPAATDTIVGRASTDTLTNKTLSGASNTFTQVQIDAEFVQEAPSGTVNGSNVTFTLAHSPPTGASVHFFIDGTEQPQGAGQSYTISGATITMATAPATGQSVWAIYSQY